MLFSFIPRSLLIGKDEEEEEKSMEVNSNTRDSTEKQTSTAKEKRAMYMSRLRGSTDSEYRVLERQNNARAMRKKRSENPLYRERERRQNRAHMAEIRRQNTEYRQREHIQNRQRMELKRRFLSQTSASSVNNETTNTTHHPPTINPIYQILENNLQSSHISFIPYQSNFHSLQQLSTTLKQSSEYELLQQIDEYCRLHDLASNTDSNSRSTTSISSE